MKTYLLWVQWDQRGSWRSCFRVPEWTGVPLVIIKNILYEKCVCCIHHLVGHKGSTYNIIIFWQWYRIPIFFVPCFHNTALPRENSMTDTLKKKTLREPRLLCSRGEGSWSYHTVFVRLNATQFITHLSFLVQLITLTRECFGEATTKMTVVKFDICGILIRVLN